NSSEHGLYVFRVAQTAVEEAKQLQLPQARNRAHRVALGKQQEDFVLQSRAGESLDQICGGRLREQTHGGAIKAKAEPLFEPDRSEDTRGIVLETARVQHANRARPKVTLPSA